MFAQTVRRSLLEARASLPPTFLLPFRAGITTVSHSVEPSNVPEPLIKSGQHISKDLKAKSRTPKNESNPTSKAASSITPPSPTKPPRPNPNAHSTTAPVSDEIKSMLPLLKSQPPYYITIHIHGRPYLVTSGDTIRLPFLMSKVSPGDVLRLNRATHIGSRDYTLKAPEPIKAPKDEAGSVGKTIYLDDRLFVCRATVLGVESEPLRIKEKTKRRQRHVKHAKSKHRFTVIRIGDLQVKSVVDGE